MSEHIVSKKLYFQIFCALMVLTVITVLAALVDFSQVRVGSTDLGFFNTIIALTIAVTKATLVVLFFMHVRYSSRLTKIIVVSGFFWLAIMVVFISTDYVTRPKDREIKPVSGVAGIPEHR